MIFQKKDNKDAARAQMTNRIKEDRKYILNSKSGFFERGIQNAPYKRQFCAD